MSAVQDSTSVSSLTNIQAAGGLKTNAATTKESEDRFLTLLVTQLKNQDPLSPLDNAQVTSQLAQLSTVSGIEKLNTTVEGLNASYQNSQALQSASLIGRGVLSPGANVNLAHGESVFGVDVSEAADNVQVTVRDAGGKAVHTIDLGPQEAGSLPLAWDGKNDQGVQVADGRYTIDVVSTRGGKEVQAASALTFGVVSSVSSGSQGVKLNIPGAGAVNFADVRQIL
jgi:flagellar basal-body rod modification protein FlgD